MQRGIVPLDLPARSVFATDKRKGKGKCKVFSRTGHEGPEREYRYSSTFSLTLALDWGGCSTPSPVGLTTVTVSVTFVQEAGWAPGPF